MFVFTYIYICLYYVSTCSLRFLRKHFELVDASIELYTHNYLLACLYQVLDHVDFNQNNIRFCMLLL